MGWQGPGTAPDKKEKKNRAEGKQPQVGVVIGSMAGQSARYAWSWQLKKKEGAA